MTCSEVLAVLSDFLDGELDETSHAAVLAHLTECDWCEKFGGRFSAVIEALRRELRDPAPLSRDVVARLRQRLENER